MGFLQHYERLLSEVEGFLLNWQTQEYAADMQILCDSNFNVACETGICYPTLQAMLYRNALLMWFLVICIWLVVGQLSHDIPGYPMFSMGYSN